MIKVPASTLLRRARSARGVIRGALLVPGLLLGLSLGCKEEAPPAPPPPQVTVADVVQKDVPVYDEWVGTTEGKINAQIRARVQGYLQSQEYTEGSVVQQDQLLFSIDPRPYEAALADAKGELGQSAAALTKAQQDVTRYRPLAKQGAVSQRELDDAVQAEISGRAKVDSARAKVDQAELNLAWTQVKSPIAGLSGIAVAQIGDLIAPNTLLTTVSQLDPIKVNFPISEQQYLQFTRETAESGVSSEPGALSLDLYLADGSKYAHAGKFALADRQVDPTTGTITIVSYFPNPGNMLRPGQFAKVRAAIAVSKGALVVPQRAVLDQQGQFQVGVVGPDNKVDLRLVEVGSRTAGEWVVTKGLKPGERVIVEGLQKVRAGTIVEAKPYVAPAAMANASPES
jgi:membrane fusion protein (multidrug efflux system)